ncbi:6842_t:CDS:1, partial [Racocetra fulgida]
EIITANIKKNQQSLYHNPSTMIHNSLERTFQQISVTKIYQNNQFTDHPIEVKELVKQHFQLWTRHRNTTSFPNNQWYEQYKPQDYIPDSAFSTICNPISSDEFFTALTAAPSFKAP